MIWNEDRFKLLGYFADLTVSHEVMLAPQAKPPVPTNLGQELAFGSRFP